MIDDIGRTAVDELRRTVGDDLAPDDMLRRLHSARRRRTRAAAGSAGLVVVASLLLGGYVSGVVGPETAAPPAGHGTPTDAPPGQVQLRGRVCGDPRIACLGGRRAQVALTVPFRVDVPQTFAGDFQLGGPDAVEDYRSDIDHVGVAVLEGARPVVYDATWETDPGAGTTAAAVARWLADRPFFSDAVTTRITVGDLPAWRVTPTMRPGARLPVRKGRTTAPTFAGNGSSMGTGPGLDGEYVLLDVPGAGLTVIWSWSYEKGPEVLVESRR
jgi:hypothetical protein